MLDALLAGLPSALPAAKRHRLRCLRCVIVLLQSPGAPPIQTQPAQQADVEMTPQEGVQQVPELEMRQVGDMNRPMLWIVFLMQTAPGPCGGCSLRLGCCGRLCASVLA